MTKQELINEVKKMDDRDFLSQPLVLEILEQLDEPPTEECVVCENLSNLVNENAHQAEQIAILERAFKEAIKELAMDELFCDDYCIGTDSLHEGKNYHEEFTCEKDKGCDPDNCSDDKRVECIFKHFNEQAAEQLKEEEFEMT